MMITVANKQYKAAPMTFGNVCKLERMGAPITEMNDRPLTVACAYVALCMNKSIDAAAEAIEAHIVGGGTLNDIMEVFKEELEQSGFFKALREKSAETQEADEEITEK